MATCRSIDPLVTPYIDGELSSAERASVDEHLRHCPPCHSRVEAEGAVRDLVQTQKHALTAAGAPAGLRARCRLLAREGEAVPPPNRFTSPGATPAHAARARRWGTPIPFAVAASLVCLVGGAFLYQATDRSAFVLAAELAADHVKCFAANDVLGTHDEPATVESSMASVFGWRMHLPERLHDVGFELVGSRRCLYAEGKVAHIMYRQQGRPVSVFMLPRSSRPEELVEVLGHEAAIWSVGDRTFVLVARGSRAEVQQMASVVRATLQ